jgi:hypothetical protein
MSLNHSPAIVTDGLVLCLDAANIRSYPKSGTTWSDLAGSNNGTMENMTVSNYSTDNGGVLSFDGSDDYVNLGTASSLFPGPIITASLCCWIKPSTTVDHIPIGDQYSVGHRLYIGIINGVWDAGFGDYLWGVGYTGSRVTATTDWTFVSLIITAGSAVLYVNGQKTITKTTDTSVTLGGFFSLGIYFNNGAIDGQFQGATTIASTQIYNRALTGDEVRQNYEATVGRYT